MASSRVIRLRRASADERTRNVVQALAEHFGVQLPAPPRRAQPDYVAAVSAEQMADVLEAIAKEADVPIRKIGKAIRAVVNPSQNETITLTDDPEENQRRKEAAQARYAEAASRSGRRSKPDTEPVSVQHILKPGEDPQTGEIMGEDGQPVKPTTAKANGKSKAKASNPDTGSDTEPEDEPTKADGDEPAKEKGESSGPSQAGGPVPSSLTSKP